VLFQRVPDTIYFDIQVARLDIVLFTCIGVHTNVDHYGNLRGDISWIWQAVVFGDVILK
jgi:hypothetical protein